MTVDPLFFYILVAVVAFMIGMDKGGLGGTLGALTTPLLAMVLPPEEVIGLILPFLMLADIFAVSFHWRRWKTKIILLLIPGAVVGVTVSTYLISNAPTQTLRTTLGVIVLIFALYKIFENRIQGLLVYHPRNWHGVLAGTIAGFSSGLAHTGGPPISIYLLLQNLSPRVFISTSVLFFFLLNWIKVPYYWYAGLFDFQHLSEIAWFLPLVPIGVWVGRWGASKVEKKTFDRIVTFLLLVAAVMLIFG